jgi:agmatine/peptidylarginine deiminase
MNHVELAFDSAVTNLTQVVWTLSFFKVAPVQILSRNFSAKPLTVSQFEVVCLVVLATESKHAVKHVIFSQDVNLQYIDKDDSWDEL